MVTTDLDEQLCNASSGAMCVAKGSNEVVGQRVDACDHVTSKGLKNGGRSLAEQLRTSFHQPFDHFVAATMHGTREQALELTCASCCFGGGDDDVTT
jgi:hypothetical protein